MKRQRSVSIDDELHRRVWQCIVAHYGRWVKSNKSNQPNFSAFVVEAIEEKLERENGNGAEISSTLTEPPISHGK